MEVEIQSKLREGVTSTGKTPGLGGVGHGPGKFRTIDGSGQSRACTSPANRSASPCQYREIQEQSTISSMLLGGRGLTSMVVPVTYCPLRRWQ